MPVTIAEKWQGRAADTDGSVSVAYVVTGTEDEAEAAVELYADVPALRGDLVREPYPELEELASGTWLATVRYVRPELSGGDLGSATYSFNTAGATQNVKQSKQSVANYAILDFAGGVSTTIEGTGSPFGGAIGVTDSTQAPEGVDVVIPHYEFEETHSFADSDVTDAYLGTLIQLYFSANPTP